MELWLNPETESWWWIDYQRFHANEAEPVSSYYNISNTKTDNKIFVSEFDGAGPFNRVEKKPIGFKR